MQKPIFFLFRIFQSSKLRSDNSFTLIHLRLLKSTRDSDSLAKLSTSLDVQVAGLHLKILEYFSGHWQICHNHISPCCRLFKLTLYIHYQLTLSLLQHQWFPILHHVHLKRAWWSTNNLMSHSPNWASYRRITASIIIKKRNIFYFCNLMMHSYCIRMLMML